MSCFVIAEAGVNHNGALDRALAMVDAAAASGADAVKFQTFNADALVTAQAAKAEYQRLHTGDGSQHAMLRALELSESDHLALVQRCSERGIEFMSTPFSEEAADFLVALGMRRIKVPSGELTNRRLIQHVARFDLPLIVSTGMATLSEVVEAIGWIGTVRAAGRAAPSSPGITLLHCTSSYPTVAADVNLRAMDALAKATGCDVGYSDHTLGIDVAIGATARGATVIEKHFTLSRDLPGPDHAASLEPGELRSMVQGIRAIEAALGDGIKEPRQAELAVRDVARRSVTLMQARPAGYTLQPADLDLRRPGVGIAPKHLDDVVGRRLTRALAAGSTLTWSDLA